MGWFSAKPPEDFGDRLDAATESKTPVEQRKVEAAAALEALNAQEPKFVKKVEPPPPPTIKFIVKDTTHR